MSFALHPLFQVLCLRRIMAKHYNDDEEKKEEAAPHLFSSRFIFHLSSDPLLGSMQNVFAE